MYPSSLPTCEAEMEKWASGLRAESHKRFGPLFPELQIDFCKDVACNVFRSHDGQLRLSWGARSTCPRKKLGFWLLALSF